MRPALLDHLQVFPFWLMDVAPIEGGSLPVLNPLLGFATATAPEITVEVHEVQEGNWLYKRKIVKKADVGNITLTRGATFHDQDFYAWILQTIGGSGITRTLDLHFLKKNIGGPTPRRTLMLIHFFSRADLLTRAVASGSIAAGALGPVSTTDAIATFAAGAAAGVVAGIAGTAAGVADTFGAGSAAAAIGLPLGPFSVFARVPARAFMLHGCLPVRYKSGTDYDAASGQVSVMELELAVEAMEQILLTG